MKHHSLSRLAGWSLLACTLGVSPIRLHAQTPAGSPINPEVTVLETYVVSAGRTPQDPQVTPSSVTLLPLAELQAAQISDLRAALAREPGVIIISTGAPGGPSSVLLRGANSHQTLFVVDGVRLNDKAAGYQNFLGGADLVGFDRVEVLRGPQSTLYGSSAMGGVILLDTAHGSGAPGGTLTATAGSFDSWGGAVAVRGGVKTVGYSASLSRLHTANDRPSNAFDQWSYSTRLECAPTTESLVGATFRGQNNDYEQAGSRIFSFPGTVNSDSYLGTVYAQVRPGEGLTSRLTAALYKQHYTFTDSFGGVSDLRYQRKILDWQNTWEASNKIELVAGANLERSRDTIDGILINNDVTAGYLSATAHPHASVTATAGVRYDDFESVGSATTWRTGLSWRPFKGTKLRATYGTGFSTPASVDGYDMPQWGQVGNPDLQPEKSRGWDVGIDQDLANGRATLSATYFYNHFRNLLEWETISYVPFKGHVVNRARATTEGIELALAAKLGALVQTRLSYTYLEAHNATTGARLTRRPRHTIDAEMRVQATKALLIGAGVHGVADRLEGTSQIEDYATARLFISYAVRENLQVKLRVENALDESYEEVFGYASLPRGVFGSVEWKF